MYAGLHFATVFQHRATVVHDFRTHQSRFWTVHKRVRLTITSAQTLYIHTTILDREKERVNRLFYPNICSRPKLNLWTLYTRVFALWNHSRDKITRRNYVGNITQPLIALQAAALQVATVFFISTKISISGGCSTSVHWQEIFMVVIGVMQRKLRPDPLQLVSFCHLS